MSVVRPISVVRMLAGLVFSVWFILQAATVQAPAPDAATPGAGGTVMEQPQRFPGQMYLVTPDRVSEEFLINIRDRGATAIAVVLDDIYDPHHYRRIQRIAGDIEVVVYGWIEVARNPDMAERHPEWMASVGVHDDWQRHFPAMPEPAENQIVKAWPWVPIWYEDAYQAHLDRIRDLLERAPSRMQGVLLNNIQGGPSSCGCGNTQCRFATDYGVPSTAETLEDPETPARFLNDVRRISGMQVVPIWTPECGPEDQPGAEPGTGYCGSVMCVEDHCWTAYGRQLQAVSGAADMIGVNTLYRELNRDLGIYRGQAGWIRRALETFQRLPSLTGGTASAIPSDRLVAMVEGHDAGRQEVNEQIRQVREAGVNHQIITMVASPVNQDWEPRVFTIRDE